MEEIKQKVSWEVEFEHLFGYEIREVQKEFPGYLSHDPDIKNFISDLLKKRDSEIIEFINSGFKSPASDTGYSIYLDDVIDFINSNN